MRYLLTLILCLWSAAAWAFPPGFLAEATSGASAATCTIGSGDNWVNTDNGDYWSSSTTEGQNYQLVANATSKNICKITCQYNNAGVSSTSAMKIKSTNLSTTYGASSDTPTLINDSTNHVATYNFSPAVTVTGDFAIDWITGQIVKILCSNTAPADKYFGGGSYDGTFGNAAHDQDFACEVWYEQ